MFKKSKKTAANRRRTHRLGAAFQGLEARQLMAADLGADPMFVETANADTQANWNEIEDQSVEAGQANAIELGIATASYSAIVVPTLAQSLDSQFNFVETDDYHTNCLGNNERWVRSETGGWFYILQDGEFYEWGGSFGNSNYLGSFDPSYYDNPDLLTAPEATPVDLQVNGSNLTVTPDVDFRGTFQVEIEQVLGDQVLTQTVSLTAIEPVVDEEETDPVENQAQPVLMVIANQDFYHQEYFDTRESLEAAGLEVVVAAATTETATPHANSGQGGENGFVTPDLALADADASDYSAIVFVGGWGSSQYQYAYEGTYNFGAYNGSDQLRQDVNDLVNEFVDQDKHVAAICHGVSVLAWARVDGESALEGKTVSAWANTSPASDTQFQTTRSEIEANGGIMVQSGSVGDPTTMEDDVIVDGNIITAENYYAAARFGEVLATEILANPVGDDPTGPNEQPGEDQPGDEDPAEESSSPSPVLMVIANQDFYYREYSETRASLEAAGLEVVVAAATTDTATPHYNSGQGMDSGFVTPDLALADVNAEDFSSIVFVGGWGSSQYQYAYEGSYDNQAYNGSDSLRETTNTLIGSFVDQDKHVAAICHGVSVLAWARVDGTSLLDGVTVSAWANTSPGSDTQFDTTRSEIEANGGTMVASGSVGDPTTVADDVIIDGNIITAENYDSAAYFGQVLASEIIAKSQQAATDEVFADWE